MADAATEAAGAVEAVEPVGAMVSGEPAARERAARERAVRERATGESAAEVGDAADELAVAGSEQAAP
jgi:hypothetical protein